MNTKYDFTPLKNFMDKVISEYKVPGADCIVYQDHEELFRYYTGFSDKEEGREMNGNELYFIYSMTKMLTCTAALQLFEQGRFLMSDPVSMYLPEFENMKVSGVPYSVSGDIKIATGASIGENEEKKEDSDAKNKITIKDLFTMGAGLDYAISADYIKKSIADGKTSTRDIVRAISETVLHFEPGTHYKYSLCHDVIGGLVEVVSGKKLGEYMKENIFETLGMKDTFFGNPKTEEQWSRMAALYTHGVNIDAERVELKCPYTLTDEYESGGAGLTSSAYDYSLFLDAMACGGIGKSGKRILSSRTVELMRTNHLSGEAFMDFSEMRPGYGYGLGVRTHMDATVSGSLSPEKEFGWDGAAGSFAMADAQNGLSLTYFQHVYNWDIRLQMELRNVLYKCIED